MENTAHQNKELLQKRSVIRRRLLNVRAVQAIYMPCVPLLLARHLRAAADAARTNTAAAANPAAMADLPKNQSLYFPHALSPEDRKVCVDGLTQIEERLRDAQLFDSLDRIRVHLHIRSRLVTSKKRNVRHQGANTRARRRIDVNDGKIGALADKYRAARVAKLALAGPGPWEKEWRTLARADVRTMQAEDDPINMTVEEGLQFIREGRRTTSWIWMASDKDEIDDALQSGMQDGE